MTITASDYPKSAAVRASRSSFRMFLADMIRNVQIGRMRSVLRMMSDDQLAKIGVNRAGIDAYTSELLS